MCVVCFLSVCQVLRALVHFCVVVVFVVVIVGVALCYMPDVPLDVHDSMCVPVCV